MSSKAEKTIKTKKYIIECADARCAKNLTYAFPTVIEAFSIEDAIKQALESINNSTRELALIFALIPAAEEAFVKQLRVVDQTHIMDKTLAEGKEIETEITEAIIALDTSNYTAIYSKVNSYVRKCEVFGLRKAIKTNEPILGQIKKLLGLFKALENLR